jgi:ectoine hydroxylase-related dioxygenase (phytanoyl-CoA dioxygenase family)
MNKLMHGASQNQSPKCLMIHVECCNKYNIHHVLQTTVSKPLSRGLQWEIWFEMQETTWLLYKNWTTNINGNMVIKTAHVKKEYYD